MRQLVVGEADRRPAERIEDLVERVGVDRRGQSVADRRGADGDPRRLTPGVGRRVIGQLVGQQDRRVGADRVGVAVPGRAVPGQPSSDACGSQSKVSSSPASSTTRTSGGRKSSSAPSSVDLPTLLRLGRDDDRDAGLDQQPERRRQLGIERAGRDQLDDRSRFGRRAGTASGPTPREISVIVVSVQRVGPGGYSDSPKTSRQTSSPGTIGRTWIAVASARSAPSSTQRVSWFAASRLGRRVAASASRTVPHRGVGADPTGLPSVAIGCSSGQIATAGRMAGSSTGSTPIER